ncbi:MAG: fibronectin type III domain-containing protein, partial [Candidatus Nanopelagicales bacterium]
RVSAYLPWLAEQGVDTGSTTSTAPRIVSAVPGVGSLTVVVAPGSGGSVENYQIYVENTADPSDAWYCDVPPTEDTCGFPDLTPGAQYVVTVRYEGSEEVSDPVYVTLDDVPSIAAPVKPKITKGWDMGGGRVKLKVRVGQQPEGTLVWVQCTSTAMTKTAKVKKGRANLRLATGWRYSCKAIAENEAGRATSKAFRFKI